MRTHIAFLLAAVLPGSARAQDTLDPGLIQGWIQQGREWVLNQGPSLLVKLAIVVVIYVAFKILSGLTRRLIRRILTNSEADISDLVEASITNIAAKLVMFVGYLVILGQIGINLGPVLAGMGIAGLVLGFALQSTLSNFAAGIMILFYRPFDMGHFVEAGGATGTVLKMSLVSTTLKTPDNQRVVVPNSKIWDSVIRNITGEDTRRVDMVFGISYGDNMAKAEAIIRDVVAAHPLVLKDPEPVIKVHTLNDSSVDFVVRPWTQTSDYWAVHWDLTRTIKERFDAEGVSIPYPHREVYMHQVQG